MTDESAEDHRRGVVVQRHGGQHQHTGAHRKNQRQPITPGQYRRDAGDDNGTAAKQRDAAG